MGGERRSTGRAAWVALWGALCLGAAGSGAGAEPAGAAADELFESKVRPVLAQVCFTCHGGRRTAGELRVDSIDGLLKGGDSGPAVDRKRPAESLLLKAVKREEGVSAMPPDKPLRPDQIEALEAWIREGAVWPEKGAKFEATAHWAFEPLRTGAPPTPRDAAWPLTSIDAYLRVAQESAGVDPTSPAPRREWLRRATYGLTGLPPTAEEADAFEQDESPDAYERAVDRLLHSPRYGEHWGRYWLDVVRYADTAGENSDHPLPHAWKYRNWVIDAFNANQPYDEFVRDQLAGDLRAVEGPPEKYAGRVIATGYLAIARRFGHDIDKDMHLTYEDVIDTLGKSLLGLTIGCTRCHDHKYDPLSARDYYGLYGIFASTKFAFPGCEPKQQPRDLTPLVGDPETLRRLEPLKARAAELDALIGRLDREAQQRAQAWRARATAGARRLAEGAIDDGGDRPLVADPARPLDAVAVKKGDVLQLTIGPRGNHGADSTLVEWTIVEQGGERRRWNTADLAEDLAAGNPHPDRHGAADAWWFLDARDGFRLLPERLTAIDGRSELQAWRNGDTPSVFVNRADAPVAVWTKLPPKSFFAHPGPNGPVAIAWIAPADMVVSTSGRAADAHPGGGDGVDWTLDLFSSTDAGGAASDYRTAASAVRELLAARSERATLAERLIVPVAYAVMEGEPADARIHRRGEPTDPGDVQPRKFLDVLGGRRLEATKTSGRRELADWIVAPSNPLAARVFVNRVWLRQFGRGLVKTPNDFGTRGAAPTHPELLDHLSDGFLRSGWDVKALQRAIMTSAAYRTSARATSPAGSAAEKGASPAAASGDATAALQQEQYARFVRRRLSAEELRDSLLAASDDLDRAPGGPHPFPPESTWSFSQHAPFAADYESSKRSVYVMQKRNRRTRYFALFDGADPNASTPVRDVTTAPTQALFFLNDPLVHQRSERLAERLLAETPDEAGRVEAACRRLFGRGPSDVERREAARFLAEYRAALDDVPAERREAAAWSAWLRVWLSGNEFLYVD